MRSSASFHNVLGGIRHHHAIGMSERLLVDRVDHIERAFRVAGSDPRINPDGKELGSEIALLNLTKIKVSTGDGSVGSEIETFIHEAPRSVSVSVDDERGVVNSARVWLVSLF